MERFKRSLSIRKKKESTPESSKPHQWQEDERKVREGNCSFQVKVSVRTYSIIIMACIHLHVLDHQRYELLQLNSQAVSLAQAQPGTL